MKKRLMIVIIAVLILGGAILLPVITLATREKKEVILPVLDEQDIEEANQKERERLHEEWEKFNAEHTISDTPTTYSYDLNSTDRTGFEEIDKAAEEAKNVQDRRNEIINRYYANEYARINEKLVEESKNGEGIVDFINSPLSLAQKEQYELIMKIIEEEELSNEESTLLKDYLRSQKSDIEKDEQLKSKLELILQ